MNNKEVIQMALDALEDVDGIDTETECVTIDVGEAIEALRAALAQPEPEPFGYFCEWFNGNQHLYTDGMGSATEDDWNQYPEVHENLPLYTAPPKREWVNLTVEDRERLRDAYCNNVSGLISAVQMMLKEKNT